MEWTGNPMDPMLNLKATERLRASVGSENGQSRMVNFDVSIVVKNRLDNLSLAFEIDAPDDAEVQNQLASMSADERGKQAIAMLATGLYLANSGSSGGGGTKYGIGIEQYTFQPDQCIGRKPEECQLLDGSRRPRCG